MISSESLIYQWTFLCFLCFFDKCVSESSRDSPGVNFPFNKHKFVSRHWSHWSEWSDCSRTCGGGVRMRTRVCRIRANGYTSSGDNCFGETAEHELCSRHSCSPYDKEFLEYQCSQRNGHIISGKKIEEWIPHRYGENPCELQCWSIDRSVLQSFGKAIDGTKCPAPNPREPALCVNGRCSVIDCAGNIGSIKKFDRCGVCGGNNSTCTKLENTFWRRPRSKTLSNGNKDHHYDYEEIFSIPVGATNILVREASRTNFLSLADHKGNYFINGNWRVQSPGQFLVHGSEFVYGRTWDGLEVLSSSGPTRYHLVVFALGSGDIPTIHYEYWTSTSNLPSSQQNLFHADSLKRNAYQSKTLEPLSNSIPSSTISKMTVLPKLQGYNSYYHRNEILKSVPSWSIKRHSTYKNPLNILSFEAQNEINSIGGKTNIDAGVHGRYFVTPVANGFLQKQLIKPETGSNITFSVKTTMGSISADEIVQLDSSGRPNGTSAQTGRTSKLFEYDLREKRLNQSDTRKRPTTKILATSGKEKQTSNKRQSNSRGKQTTHNKRKRKSDNENCSPCSKVRHQTKHFCLSEFVLRVVVLSSEKQHESIRFEMEVTRSYKNKVPILPREYIWTMDTCQCPKLRVGREYILMGHTKTFGSQRESRLVADRHSFVRRYSQKRARTMLKLVRDQNSICKKY